MATAFKMMVLKEQQVDIIISDLIYNSNRLYENVAQSRFFENVFYLKNYELDYVKRNKKEELINDLFRRKIMSRLLPSLGKYDYFYIVDSLKSINIIYEILKRKNKNIILYYYEEGPIAVLCDQGNHFKKKNEYFGLKRKLLNTFLGLEYVDGSFSAAYSSVYNKMPSNYFEWRKMPIISCDCLKQYVMKLNQFWEYKHDNTLKRKIVFLEESFYTDDRGDKDLEIVRDLLNNSYGRDVIVKLHPRTRENRFNKLGIEVYKDSSIPWELVTLNGDLDDTILVCVGSGAILYPKLYWNIEQKSIALLNCDEYRFKYLDNEYYRTFTKVCGDNNIAYMPQNRVEFLKILGELCSGKN